VEQVRQPEAPESMSRGAAVWRNPGAWLQEQKLGRGFWIFFTAALFFDFGFSIYVFLFNLYLLDFHFNDRAIGLIGGALTLGSVVGTLPAGQLARKIGLRPLLIVCFVAAPLLSSLRVVAMWETAQIGLAFLAGLAMCLWGVCFLPALARLTTEKNRASAFSLIFSASIGTTTLGGVVCGYLPQWLSMAGFAMQPAEVKRLILLVSCGIAAMGLLAMLRTRLPLPKSEALEKDPKHDRAKRRRWRLHPFLLRFLPTMALWTVVLTSFTPFANVYLSRNLHVPMSQIGLIFSAAQIVQLCVTLLTPMLFRVLGMVNGIVATQLLTALALGCLAGTQNTRLAVALYLSFSALQWMSAPGLYNLLMSKVPDEERSTASSMTMFCNAVMGSGATAGAGILFVRFGYPHVLAGIATLAVVAAILFWILVGPMDRPIPTQPRATADLWIPST
jgi:MFS family permease